MDFKSFLAITFLLCILACSNESTKFGKNYNRIRVTYGSPIIHDYMVLKSTSPDFEHWRTPEYLIKSFNRGFHFGKGFHIHDDSVLQKDDVFRLRLDDTTYYQINILTYGNPDSVNFSCSTSKVDSRSLNRTAIEYLNLEEKFPEYPRQKLTIDQADSILQSWGVNLKK